MRSVKWLERVEVQSRPWQGYFQHVAYRLLPEDGKPGPGAGIPLGLVALNSDVLSPANGETVAAGAVGVHGYAFAGGERHVARVDVSVDGGSSWAQAGLLEDLGRWAWRHWRITVDLAPGEHEILVRAWDSSAATQPEDDATLWNPKGYVNNARPRVRVRAASVSSAVTRLWVRRTVLPAIGSGDQREPYRARSRSSSGAGAVARPQPICVFRIHAYETSTARSTQSRSTSRILLPRNVSSCPKRTEP